HPLSTEAPRCPPAPAPPRPRFAAASQRPPPCPPRATTRCAAFRRAPERSDRSTDRSARACRHESAQACKGIQSLDTRPLPLPPPRALSADADRMPFLPAQFQRIARLSCPQLHTLHTKRTSIKLHP